jgi:hypothetical protein
LILLGLRQDLTTKDTKDSKENPKKPLCSFESLVSFVVQSCICDFKEKIGVRMDSPLVVILMGSKADEAHCQKIAEAARGFGLEAVLRIGSAHKTPEHVLALLRQYEADPRPKVYITVAGRSNALSGFSDGLVGAPVIACPPPSELRRRGYLLFAAHALWNRPGGGARAGQRGPAGG